MSTVRALAWALPEVPATLTPGEAARRLAHRERLTAWSGDWSAGAVLTCDPVRVADDPVAALADLPAVEPGGAARVGGGWFGLLPFAGTGGGMAFYPDCLRYDGAWHYEALLDPAADPRALDARRVALVADLLRPAATAPAELEVLALPDRVAHCIAVEECVRAIRRGDVYQANIASHVDLRLHGSPVDAWARIVAENAPARAGFVAGPTGTAVSASPELFLRRRGRAVRTAPIKGTRPRTGTDDERERARLAASAKDAAENVMIVDLMRNDLSRVCTGVTVPRLLAVEPHAGVWHLVSEVTGELVAGATDADLLRATFPPGSVTGAPKIRAVALIEELEATPRALFTGALGYVSPVAGLELAVAIRTLELGPDGRGRLGVGGGVTVDSTPTEEYAEILTKAAPLIGGHPVPRRGPAPTPAPVRAPEPVALFETMLVVDGRVRGLADHVGRVRRSWFELTGAPLGEDVAAVVLKAAAPLVGAHRLRLDVGDGPPRATTAPLDPGPDTVVLRVRRSTGSYPHKSADRAWLQAHERAVGPDEVALLVDPGGAVLETTRHSVFAHVDGGWRTPPLDGRILPGTARTAFLDDHADARPAPLTLADLARADAALVTNALRGTVPVAELRDEAGRVLATWDQPRPRVR